MMFFFGGGVVLTFPLLLLFPNTVNIPSWDDKISVDLILSSASGFIYRSPLRALRLGACSATTANETGAK